MSERDKKELNLPQSSGADALRKLRQTQQAQNYETKSYPKLEEKYALFKRALSPKSDVVYHPCGGLDVTPSSVFTESRVIYADIDDKSIQALREKGLEGHTVSALEYNPGTVDILILLNPTIPPDIPSSYVAVGGHVVCNNYHGTASSLHKNPQYTFAGIIRKSDGILIFDTEKLDDCWKEVETDEEFKKAPGSFGQAYYREAAKLVELVTGKKDNVLVEYRKIIELAREQQCEENAALIAKNSALADILEDPNKQVLFTFKFSGRDFTISAKLPPKKGTVDDIFIFQKIAAVPESGTRAKVKSIVKI